MATTDIRLDTDLARVDWARLKADLAADDFDNGRSPAALRRSFDQSQHSVLAWDDEQLVGTARLLSDGVCNAYLVDVWTHSAYRRRGIASAMIEWLAQQVPGQHIGLQADGGSIALYRATGFAPQPEFWSRVVGEWLDNDACRLP